MTTKASVQYAPFQLQPLQYRSTLHRAPAGRSVWNLKASPSRGVPFETAPPGGGGGLGPDPDRPGPGPGS
ncbi:hypothetical protein PG994_009141 [Apiospora phragmitis]|uniref:Uncharacterized protein n=1 Tax=Apiospora phragmitis TaxID=2905665 RepID=A0ABR1UIF3_9PEZI